MADEMLDRWAADLEVALVGEVSADLADAIAVQAASLASSAAAAAGSAATVSTAGAVAGAGTVAGVSTAIKLIAATLATAVGLATAAATGILPDQIQSWVADIADQLGVELPRPDDLPSVTVPDRLPSVTLPPDVPILPEQSRDDLIDSTLPDVTVPQLPSLPTVTPPGG